MAVLSGLAPAVNSTAAHAAEGPDVTAHRGSSGMAPENTAAAVDLAVDQRAGFVEIDVQRTKDGKLADFHDCTVERTTDVEEVYPGRPGYRVPDLAWAELRGPDAGSWFHEDHAGEPLTTVGDVIARVRNTRTGLLAEISPCGHHVGIATDFAKNPPGRTRCVRRALAQGRLAVQSFQADGAREFHALLPGFPQSLTQR
ncbi:Glycerophosphodiester phosphodiesterase [Streptomyces sp. enrichment culture]|uniref:glycerophosphodiester phosphodiesterase n=1 Tax=Streptomyces sp. enrichment culture TaxID=1795815 RepID=UPI003F579A5D